MPIVLQSTNGTGLFALQGAPNDPAHNRVHLDKAQAAAEPIEKSTAQLQQETAVVQIQQQEREQRRSMAISPSLCTR
ncbi:MAG: XVIPCD domain-containing protein [Pseudoxanthomonas sp.]